MVNDFSALRHQGRLIAVVSESSDMAVALSGEVDRAYATVVPIEPEILEQALKATNWPWLLVGDVEVVSSKTAKLLRSHPIIVVWRKFRPVGLPEHTYYFEKWSEVPTFINSLFRKKVGGMKLAVATGVEMPTGRHARSAKLQALISHYPNGWELALGAFDTVPQTLHNHGIRWKPTLENGKVVFREKGEETKK